MWVIFLGLWLWLRRWSGRGEVLYDMCIEAEQNMVYKHRKIVNIPYTHTQKGERAQIELFDFLTCDSLHTNNIDPDLILPHKICQSKLQARIKRDV